MKRQTVHRVKAVCTDADAADLISVEVLGVTGQCGQAIYKQLRGDAKLEERVLRTSFLDAARKANLKEGDFVSLTFRVNSLDPKKRLFGFNKGILAVGYHVG